MIQGRRRAHTRHVYWGTCDTIVQHRWMSAALYRLYLGVADGMSVARVWACWYSKRLPLRLSEAVILSTGTPIPVQWTCRRRRRDRAGLEPLQKQGSWFLEGLELPPPLNSIPGCCDPDKERPTPCRTAVAHRSLALQRLGRPTTLMALSCSCPVMDEGAFGTAS